MKTFLQSMRHALRGIVTTWIKERNFRIQTLLALVICVIAVFTGLSNSEWMILIMTISIVLAAELCNTAIERLADLIESGHNSAIGIIKDTMAGTVLVVSISALIIAIFLLLPHFM